MSTDKGVCRRCGTPDPLRVQSPLKHVEWTDWRGKIVTRQHHTYCQHSKGICNPKVVPFQYVVVGGMAAVVIRAASRPFYDPKEIDEYLVLVPITRDTDEDSYELVLRSDVMEV